MIKGMEIEKVFIKYFEWLGHKHLPSGPIVVRDDPSIMFCSAGMVQFKEWFQELALAKHPRVVTSQNCLRAGGKHNDLENVGYTDRHHTFFRMLGNFSFGDYFKEEAIKYAWDFLTKELGINESKLSITVHNTDQESREIWGKILGGESRITDEGDEDNFWTMGDHGPCGPCSEIFYSEEGEEPTEIWNLVFMEYNQTDKGREKLAKPCVDTGMGLERIVAVMEGKKDNYETSLFYPNIKEIARVCEFDRVKKKGIGGKILPGPKVMIDHLTSAAHLFQEGVEPSNTGEGYVLRKIMRRMFLHLIKGNPKSIPNLLEHFNQGETLEIIAEDWSKFFIHADELFPYPEWGYKKLRKEFKLWLDVCEAAYKCISAIEIAKKTGAHGFIEVVNGVLTGRSVFMMEDTYGIPSELIELICCKSAQVKMNITEHHALIEEREARGRDDLEKKKKLLEKLAHIPATGSCAEYYWGAIENCWEVRILDVINFENRSYVVLEETPFYPQGGGQVGDKGTISLNRTINSGPAVVKNTIEIKRPNGETVILHELLEHPEIPEDFQRYGYPFVMVKIDTAHRKKVSSGHTATHILNQILQDTLGDARQCGSHIIGEKFTFDFAWNVAMDPDQVMKIEEKVNEVIRDNLEVQSWSYPSYDAAKEAGARSLPGEGYGTGKVRVLKIERIKNIENQGKFKSMELCGGTHAKRTGDIGYFKIIKESSISSGIRRIEAMVGEEAIRYTQKLETELKSRTQELEKENKFLKRIDSKEREVLG